METSHWFDRALEIPPEFRREFLEANCPDGAVRSEVASLLEYEHDGRTIDRVVRGVVGTLFAESRPAGRVGPFEVGRMLGSGGMGVVYEGMRVDGEVRQRVAIKFANVPEWAPLEERASARRRFLRERQMLASLRHPYIAGLIDAGATADGVPYAVIEEVDGIPIDRYCQDRRLDRTERLRLVLKLCEAVQFAHSKLIVHSDIKPQNVLITEDGIPKLIDFGIGSDLSEGAETELRAEAFTPGYASPEQCLGAPPTVATDVFGIGATLYRLLTEARPKEIPDFPAELRGDLENILLKAMHRDPELRYGSVAEFRDDLNRYLARRPVRATPDSTLYRVSRFVRRQWAPMVAAASIAVALATGAIVSVRENAAAARRAVESRRLAERLLFDVHDELDGLVGGTKARERLGAIVTQYLEGLERGAVKDPDVAWELLNAYSRLSQSRSGAASSIGDTNSGIQLALKTLQLGAVVEATNPDPRRLDGLFNVYEKLVIIFGEGYFPDRQKETIDRLLRLATQLAPIRQAQAWKELARYLELNGGAQEAVEANQRALAILRPLASAGSNAPAAAQFISTLIGLGRSQVLAGDFSGALANVTEGIGLAERSSRSDPQRAKSVRQLYWGHIVLGDALASPATFNLGRTAEGVEEYEKARAIAESLVKADPANEAARLDLARALSRAGLALAAVEPARALELLERVNGLRLKVDSECVLVLDCRLAYRTGSAEALVRLGAVDRARSHLAEAHLLTVPGSGNASALLRAEAIVLHASGRTKEAIEVTERQLSRVASASLSESFYKIDALQRLRVYTAGTDRAAYAAEQLAIAWDQVGRTHPQLRAAR